MHDIKIKHQVFQPNTAGRDFVCGDLHGMLGSLTSALHDLGFDKNKDRLFCVGDLIDRGLYSHECLMLCKEPWFFSVKGNHEEMLLDAGAGCDASLRCWLQNGGGWETCEEDFDVLKSLPLKITIRHSSGKTFGIVHAEFPLADWLDDDVTFHHTQDMIWGRLVVKKRHHARVKNVDMIFCGHTPLEATKQVGNHFFIDTGACWPDEGKLTIINLDNIQ